MSKQLLKEEVRIFRNVKLACIQGIYYLEFHDWNTSNIKLKRKPISIVQAVEYANRDLNHIPDNKSATISSNYEQKFCNTYRKILGIPFTSERGLLDESEIIWARQQAKKIHDLQRNEL